MVGHPPDAVAKTTREWLDHPIHTPLPFGAFMDAHDVIRGQASVRSEAACRPGQR